MILLRQKNKTINFSLEQYEMQNIFAIAKDVETSELVQHEQCTSRCNTYSLENSCNSTVPFSAVRSCEVSHGSTYRTSICLRLAQINQSSILLLSCTLNHVLGRQFKYLWIFALALGSTLFISLCPSIFFPLYCTTWKAYRI